MDILIFGASGGTGHELVKQSLALEYNVVAFVRDPSRLSIRHDRLDIRTGDVGDYHSVFDAVEPGVAVLSALGASSPFKRDPTIVRGIDHIVKAMEEKRAQRIVYLSFAGVHEARKQTGFFFCYMIAPLLQGVVKDHEEKEKLIRQSGLRWTIVRPAVLSNGAHSGRYNAGEDLMPRFSNLMIPRADVADFMIRQITDDSYTGKAPLISRAQSD